MRISDWSSDVCSSDLLDLVIRAVDDVRHHANALFEFDHGNDRRFLEAERLRMARNRPAVHGAATGQRHFLAIETEALRTHRPRREREQAAVATLLAKELFLIGAVDRKSTRLNSSH